MTLVVSITLQDVYSKLSAFIADVVPVGTEIVQGLDNRVPQPLGAHVVMRSARLRSLRTPVETWDRTDPNPNAIAIEQGTEIRVQLDVYGSVSADWALALMVALRSSVSESLLAPVVSLYGSDPIQAPLTDAEQQYEQRWIIDAHLQYNPVLSAPMQFANTAEAELINVDEAYPP